MENLAEHMPFWSFFHELEKQLSYERWIDKYKLFLSQLYGSEYLQRPDDPTKLLQLCKALYLQNIKDEVRFEDLFHEAWKVEKLSLEKFFLRLLQEGKRKAAPAEVSDVRDDTEAEKKTSKEDSGADEALPKRTESVNGSESSWQTKKTKEYYYNPPVIPEPEMVENASGENEINAQRFFNYQDEYLPIQRREMNKAWQYLRRSEKGAPTGTVDIKATVNKLAREIIFTEPVFVPGKQNRQDTVILLVDCNGSMVPFHELSRRLVNSARGFGGHSKAKVFYFQNYPFGYVYQKANLTKPVKSIEAFADSNNQLTTLIVISDAGFARGYGSDDRYQTRLAGLGTFFELIKNRCAQILWLNPMPENRWHKSTTWEIENRILMHKAALLKIESNVWMDKSDVQNTQSLRIKMKTLSGSGMNTFQNAIKNMSRKQ